MNNINIAITKEDTNIKTDTFLQSSYYIGKKINLISLPTIITVPLYTEEIKKSLKKIEEGFYDYYIYLSANAVNIFFNKIKEEKTYSKIIENIQRINKDNFDSSIIAIGPKTKKEIEKYGLKANIAEFSNIQKKEDGYKRIGIYRKEVFQKEPDYSSKSIISFLDNLNNNIKEGIKIKILIPRSSESQQSNNIITKKYDNIILDQIFYYKTLEYNNIKDSIQWNIFKEL